MTGGVYQFDIDPNNNQSLDNIDYTEGATQPSAMNNNARQHIGRIAEWRSDLAGTSTTGGTGNAYTLTIQAQIDQAQGYFSGLVFGFVADRANTGAATINITPQGQSALGTTPLKSLSGRELTAGELQAGGYYLAHHDGTQAVVVASTGGTVTIDKLSADVRGRLKQVGDVELWMGDSADLATEKPGYLVLEGGTYSRTLPLFNVWGTKFGPGNGTTTAGLPDFRGQVPRGLDPSGAFDPDVLARLDRGDGQGGAVVGSRQNDEFAQHTHIFTGIELPAHTHPFVGTPFVGTTSALSGLEASTVVANPVQPALQSVTAGTPSGTNSQEGGNETRGKNIAVHFVVLADAEAAAGSVTLARTSGYGYTFDTSTTIDEPAVGQLNFNNTDLVLVSQIAIHQQTAEDGNPNIRSVILNWGVAPSTTKRTLKFSQSNNPAIFSEFTLTNVTDNGLWLTLDVLYVGDNGAIGNNEPVTVDAGGATGAGVAGAPGPNIGLDYQWNTATTGDPGSGKLLLNGGGATLSISKTNRQGASNAASIASWDNSTNPNNRGVIRVVDVAASGTNFRELHVTGTVVDQTTYYDIPVTSIENEGTLTNDMIVAVAFSPAGDKGVDGAGAGDVVGPASSTGNAIAGYANTTGKLLQNTPVTVDPANGNMANVGTIGSGAITSTGAISGTTITGSDVITGTHFQATGTEADNLSGGTTAQRPGSPTAGDRRYNTTDNVQEFYNGTRWVQLSDIESFIAAASDETSDLTTGTAKVTFRMPYAFTLTAVRASVTTAPTGSVLTVDINEGGTSVLSTKLTIDAGEKTSETAATPPVISDSSLADDADITIDIDTIGSTVAGAGLKVALIGHPT